MKLPKFEYFEPHDLNEAISILKNHSTAKILAGGTDLLVNMKHRVECPSVVVNIKRLSDLNYIRQDNGDIRMGALSSLKRLHSEAIVAEHFPALAQAAAGVGSYHHQAMGTLAGNLCQQNRCMYFNQSKWWRNSRPTCLKAGGDICHVVNKKQICYSTYCGDMAPAFMILNAKVSLVGPDGVRDMSVEEFFSGDGKAPLVKQQGEILTEIIIPKKSDTAISSYVKFANRGSIDFPIVGAAFWASAENKEYRLAFTGVDRKPLRSRPVEDFLKGKELNADHVKAASDLAAKTATPVKTSVYSPLHKRKMMGLLLQKAVKETKRRSA